MSEENMTPKERIDTVLEFKEPDRVPCGPFLDYYLPFNGGFTVWEYLHDSVKSLEGAIRVYKKFNGFDIFCPGVGVGSLYYSPSPKNACIFASAVYVKAKFPTKDNPMMMPQFDGDPLIPFDDTFLDRLLEKGLEKGVEAFAIQTPEKEEMYNYSLKQVLAAIPNLIKFVVEEQVYPYGCAYFAHPAGDLLPFYGKNWMRWFSDLYRKPDKLIEIFDSAIDSYINRAITGARSMYPEDFRMLLWADELIGIRPEIWERVIYPTWKKAVHAFCKEGLKIWFHADGDFTPVLELLGEIFSGPAKGKCILQFDQTDMYKAKEILGDKVCLSGNLKASLMSLGTPHEVDKECKKLIENLGEGSGYVLGAACEIPYNAPFENVKAMRESVDKYRIYR